jgi:hypothetical protein
MKFDAWKDEPYQSLEDAFPDIQAEFEDYYHTEEQMAALFPTFTNVFRRFGNWLKSQDRVEVYVIGECLYWEFKP